MKPLPTHILAAIDEAIRWQATLTITDKTGHHYEGVLTYKGQQRKLFFSKKTTEKAIKHICKGDVRRVIHQLGGM